MIFNKDLLFVHVPKAAGMSITKHLLAVLPRPVFYMHPSSDPPLQDRGIFHILGIRHENLAEARNVVWRYGLDIQRLAAILVAIRNPYELEVSRYAYLQQGHPWDRGHNQELAMHQDFETFALQSTHHAGDARPIESYFLLEGRIPENLHLLRVETLSADLNRVLRSVGTAADMEVVRDNVSAHGSYARYYTEAAEAAVYRRYQWLFDQGFYPRIDRTSFEFVQEPPSYGQAVPVEGHVEQTRASARHLARQLAVGNLRLQGVRPSASPSLDALRVVRA